ncbi:MAG: amidohydrolase [Porticoccaceae bacterium]|nr:MAG: amidohydrolase [Porticoccaceae bacterium]
MNDHSTWLSLTREEVFAPELAVVDCHHHFWRGLGEVFRHAPDYLAEQLVEDLASGHRVLATVVVECGQAWRASGPESLRSLGETAFMLAEAASARLLSRGGCAVGAGLVTFVDLRLGEAVEEVLLAHRELAGARLQGIRQRADRPLDDHGRPTGAALFDDPSFRAGLRRLARHDLLFEVWLLHPQLPELYRLARDFPEQTFVLDHLGAPLGIGAYAGRTAEVRAAWREEMKRLAELHNVVVKLGGFGMPLWGFAWERRPRPPDSDELVAAVGDWIREAVERFTPRRCLFESNFPVDKLAFSYRTFWNACKKIALEFGPRAAEDLLAGNARRLYGLDGTFAP